MTLLSRFVYIHLFLFNSAVYGSGNSKWSGMHVMREQTAIFVEGQGGSSDVNCDNIREGQKKTQRMSNMIANLRSEI